LAEGAAKQRYTLGPRFLVAVAAAAIAFGIALTYVGQGQRPSYLFFFFLPIAGVSVVLGKMAGLLLALVTIAAALLPALWLGLGGLVPATGVPGERAAILVAWAVFLMATAYLVGLVSERGGSLSFAQGLGAQAIHAMELERKRTGQDIHDGLAQYAAAALFEAEVLAGMTATADEQTRMQVDRVKQPLDLLVFEARTMIGNLRPPALGPGDFVASLTGLAESFQARTGISSELELEGDFGLHSHSARICVYRITQEALANIEQHSGASAVKIWARANRGSVDLVVRDNGGGFDPERLPPVEGDHFGLSGMRERAEYLGGRLVVDSRPGEGTSIVLHIPRYRGGGNARV
jgi:signal transduction histidine kinase